MPYCERCKSIKAASEFSKDRGNIRGLSDWCKECWRDYRQNYRSKYQMKVRRQLKDYSWKRHYGIDRETYMRLFHAQNGACAICGKPETRLVRGVVAKLCVDHDHTTGRIRGLLCNDCNSMIGHGRDNTALLQRAIRYLQTPPVQGLYIPEEKRKPKADRVQVEGEDASLQLVLFIDEAG